MKKETKRRVVAIALKDMFDKGRLDICCIRECLKIAKIPEGGDDFDTLHALHMVKFAKMPLDVREEITDTIIGLFAQTPMEVEELEIVINGEGVKVIEDSDTIEDRGSPPKGKGFLGFLLGGGD